MGFNSNPSVCVLVGSGVWDDVGAQRCRQDRWNFESASRKTWTSAEGSLHPMPRLARGWSLARIRASCTVLPFFSRISSGFSLREAAAQGWQARIHNYIKVEVSKEWLGGVIGANFLLRIG